MKTNLKRALMTIMVLMMVFSLNNVYAGNKDRSGQAGASELLINPWARSSGWAGANSACVRGLESTYLNVAGLAFTKKTELVFTHSQWMQGSDVSINAFGFSQKLGEEKGVIGLSIMSMAFGEIDITTTDLPEGGVGTYSPSLMNIGISYAKTFSNSIYGGVTLRIISESIADNSAQGVAIDAGIQYVTGALEQVKFGISMKNVGPTMMFSGDGLSFRGFIPGKDNSFTVEHRSAAYELPSLIKIGMAYDFHLGNDYLLTAAGNFTSNSFTKDQFSAGLQFNMKKFLTLRAGYMYEDGITDKSTRTTALTGPTGGFSINVPLNKTGSVFNIDYSYRDSDPWSGTHTIGARISL